jgi:hypothetical protein
MATLIWCSVYFATALVLHVVLWRIYEFKSPLKVLLTLFFGVFFLGVFLNDHFRFQLDSMGVMRLSGTSNYWHALVLFAPLALAYINLYSALQVDSPTLSLTHELHCAGPLGMSEEDLNRFLASRPFASDRLRALVDSGAVVEQEGRYMLGRRPNVLFRFVLFFRRLYAGCAEG